MRWAIIDIKAFAIFYALIKLEYLLRDINFTLKTNHHNLTYINIDYKGRVRRWKLAILEYSFDVQYIPGKHNVIADAISRQNIEDPCPQQSNKSNKDKEQL